MRVWVDGQLLIDDWTPHCAEPLWLGLTPGRRAIRHPRRLFEGPAPLRWSFLVQCQPAVAVDSRQSALRKPIGTPRLLQRHDRRHNLTRVDATVDFNWGLAAPDPTLEADNVTVSWTGQTRADHSEEYTFSTISDDGVRLWIGNELVIDNWTIHMRRRIKAKKWLEAGKWYDVRLEYFDNTGLAEIEWRWSSPRQTGAGTFEVVPQDSLRAMKRAAVTFENPLGPGADPFVIQWQGNYYMTLTTEGNSVSNRAEPNRSRTSTRVAPAATRLIAWSAPTGTNYSHQVWAPELHRLGDKWYIYVAASDGNNAAHRMHVLERNDPDPFGPFVYKGQITAPTDRWAIDGTVLEWQDNCTSCGPDGPVLATDCRIYTSPKCATPVTFRGDRVLISTPQYAWEHAWTGTQRGATNPYPRWPVAHHLFRKRVLDASICAGTTDLQWQRIAARIRRRGRKLLSRYSTHLAGRSGRPRLVY